MNRMEDARADVKKALEARAPVKATALAAKLEKLLGPEVAYWENLKQDDAAKIARQTAALGRTLAAGGSASRMRKALDKLTDACIECHALHPEKRLTASTR